MQSLVSRLMEGHQNRCLRNSSVQMISGWQVSLETWAALFLWQIPSPISSTWTAPPSCTTWEKCPTFLVGESRAKAGYAPAQPIDLGVVAHPRSPDNPRRRGCQEKEQADLLLMVPGDDESEGSGLVCHFC